VLVWEVAEHRLVYVVQRPEHANGVRKITYIDPDGNEIDTAPSRHLLTRMKL
jgi:hypothetical protein